MSLTKIIYEKGSVFFIGNPREDNPRGLFYLSFHNSKDFLLDFYNIELANIENNPFVNVFNTIENQNIISELKKRGHEIEIEEELAMFGRGQIIVRLENGVYIAGCESRTDSNIACY